jgi:uncharacterized protein (TIGR03382 family)
MPDAIAIIYDGVEFQVNVAPVTTTDEPGALSLLCVGLLLVAAVVRRR